jgi:hypothetical protein
MRENFIEFLESPQNTRVSCGGIKTATPEASIFQFPFTTPTRIRKNCFTPIGLLRRKMAMSSIIDTKAGITAESNDTKYKAEALTGMAERQKGF